MNTQRRTTSRRSCTATGVGGGRLRAHTRFTVAGWLALSLCACAISAEYAARGGSFEIVKKRAELVS